MVHIYVCNKSLKENSDLWVTSKKREEGEIIGARGTKLLILYFQSCDEYTITYVIIIYTFENSTRSL